MAFIEMRKRILISVDWFPPAYKAGGPIQSAHNLAGLLARHHDVWVVTGNRDLGETKELVSNHDIWIPFDVPQGTIQVRYSERLSRGDWKQLLEEVNPDFLHLNSLFSLEFTLLPMRLVRASLNTKVCLAPRGMLGKSALAIKPLKKQLFLSMMKMTGGMNHVLWHASSMNECDEVLESFPKARNSIKVAQNLPLPLPLENPERPADHWRVLIVGRIHRVKNVMFGLSALLKCKSTRPIHVDFIGPLEDVEYGAELEGLSKQNPAVSVRLLGGMPPSELAPHYQGAHFLLSSTMQENFGHSIVEAWAHGCPVLISDRTPWKELENKGIGWEWPLDEAIWIRGLTEAFSISNADWQEKSAASRAFFADHVQSDEVERANLALFEL